GARRRLGVSIKLAITIHWLGSTTIPPLVSPSQNPVIIPLESFLPLPLSCHTSMAPRTRQRNTATETAPVVPAADTSVRPKSSKKSKKKKMHQTQDILVALGKRPLSPEEDPTINGEQGRAQPKHRHSKKQQVKGDFSRISKSNMTPLTSKNPRYNSDPSSSSCGNRRGGYACCKFQSHQSQ
ncbi:hypothetical protein V8E53_011725, partial [Lactarius tabidus]